jgi:hypothetical protein
MVPTEIREAASRDITWRLTIGFEFRAWRDDGAQREAFVECALSESCVALAGGAMREALLYRSLALMLTWGRPIGILR